MSYVWFVLLVVLVPGLLYRSLRPRERGRPLDFAPFPLMLRGAGGIRQYPVFLLLGAAANVPLLLLLIIDARMNAAHAAVLVCVWFAIVAPALIQGAVAYGALRPLRRVRPRSREILRHGFGGLIRSVPVALVVGCLTLFPVALGQPAIRSHGPGPDSFESIVWASTWLISAVVACALYLAPVVAVDRNRAPLRALRESLAVTYHYRLRTLGIILFFVILHAFVVGLAWQLATRTGTPLRLDSTFVLIAIPIGTVLGTWHAVTAVIVYHRLRKLKYGGEVDGLLDVFE